MNWDDDEVIDKEEQKQNNPFAASKGKYSYDDSESSEEEKRVLKTPKEKLLALIKENFAKFKDHLESKNYIGILEAFNEVMKNSDKIKKEFGTGDKLPDVFIRMLYLVEDCLNLSKEEKSKLSQKNNTAFNSLKKESKLIKPYEEALKSYRDTKPTEDELFGKDEEEELSDLSKSLSDMSSVDYHDDNQDPAVRRLKWVKKPKEENEKTKEKDAEKIKNKVKKPVKVKQSDVEDRHEEKEIGQKKAITEADIEKELNEITNQRGHLQRPEESASRIDYLLTLTNNLTLKIKLLNLYILICFDTSLGQFSALPLEMWTKIHDSILTLFEYYHVLITTQADSNKDGISNVKNILQGTLVSILEKLELELYKSLQFTDQNSSEYISRIKDELKFLLLCSKIEAFYTELNDQVSISRIYVLILLHIYYKNEESIKKMIERFNLNIDRDEYLIKSCESPEKFITQLCNSIYTYCDEKSKIKAMLCNIYFLCVHDRYNTAKDLLKRSQVFEVIQIMRDDSLKILYNRTLAKLGLCAFRNGKFSDSLHYLNPLCQTGTSKLKEYLSQSYNKENEKSIFFDKEDKKRVIPYIMTINIDEVECSYYIASMISDLPNIVLFKLGRKHKPFNPLFKKLLDMYEKQIFNGPAETIKELILCSSSYMSKGDWKKCSEMIKTLKIYNHHKSREEIKKTINQHIKETSLKCYLILYSNEFSSFSLDNLVSKFSLDKLTIKRIISSMIINGEIEAKWNGENFLQINLADVNLKMINQLEENLKIISSQNLSLIEAVSIKSNK